jgi:hypothetical protein
LQFTRDQYRKIFRQVFLKGELGEFEPGWERWRQLMAAQNVRALLVLHEPDTASPPPADPESDRYVLAFYGPMTFQARVNAKMFSKLASFWEPNCVKAEHRGLDKCEATRVFVLRGLVCGYGLHPTVGPDIAAAIVWLLTDSRSSVEQFHFLGYDISFNPRVKDLQRLSLRASVISIGTQ